MENNMQRNGYDIFDFDGTGMLEIQKVDELAIFESDDDAVKKAITDGIKLIPVDELPSNFDRKYLGWIDTPENRKRIAEHCSESKQNRTYYGMTNTEMLALWCSQTKVELEKDIKWLESKPDFNDFDNADELWDTYAQYEVMFAKLDSKTEYGLTDAENEIYQSIAKDILTPIYSIMEYNFDEEVKSKVEELVSCEQ